MMDLIEKLVGGLFLVIPIIWLFAFVYSKYAGGTRAEKGLMRVVTNLPLGPKKSISVVNIAGEYLVLGVSTEQINFLTRINDRSVSDRLENSRGAGNAPVAMGANFLTKLFQGQKLSLLNSTFGKGKAALRKNV